MENTKQRLSHREELIFDIVFLLPFYMVVISHLDWPWYEDFAIAMAIGWLTSKFFTIMREIRE